MPHENFKLQLAGSIVLIYFSPLFLFSSWGEWLAATASGAIISFPLTGEGYHYAAEQFSASRYQGGVWRVARAELARLREAVYAK